MNQGKATVRRILGVCILLAGAALIVVSRDGPVAGTVLGVVLLVVGFWLYYVQGEIAKMRRHRRTRRKGPESHGRAGESERARSNPRP